MQSSKDNSAQRIHIFNLSSFPSFLFKDTLSPSRTSSDIAPCKSITSCHQIHRRNLKSWPTEQIQLQSPQDHHARVGACFLGTQWLGPRSKKMRGRFRNRERQGEGPMKMSLKVGWMQLQAKQHLRPPEAGRSKEGCSPRAFRGTLTLVVPWFWTSDPQSSELINSY